MEQQKNNSIPLAIVIAGVIIAGAIFYTKRPAQLPITSISKTREAVTCSNPANTTNHVLGSPDAPVTLVIYDDFECPFCKKFHETTKAMMEDFGKQGKVKMIFRQFPLEQLHTKARIEAEATECADEIGGNNAFWAFVDRLFEITPSNDRLDSSDLYQIAEYVGLDKDKFSKCMARPKFSEKIECDIKDGIAAGAEGTPYYVLINAKGEKFPIKYGALPWTDEKMPAYSLKDVVTRVLDGKSPYDAINKLIEEYQAKQKAQQQ